MIWTIQTYFNAKDNILYIFDINKTKISMTRVSKYYEAKIKDVQEQPLQLKMKFLLVYNMKVVI